MADRFICEAIEPAPDKLALDKRQRDLRGRYSSGDLARSRRLCAQCGAQFKPNRLNGSQIKSGYVQRCCSGACAAQHRRVYTDVKERKQAEHARRRERLSIEHPLAPRTCSGCSGIFIPKGTNHLLCSRLCRPKAVSRLSRSPHNCMKCGSEFIPFEKGRRKFCSFKCGESYHKLAAGNTHRKRARYHGVAYEYINPLKVLERDNYRCQVCGIATPMRLRGTTDDRAPELDHRIPLALGGGHVWSNVQCACRRCNAAKGGVHVAGQTNFLDVLVEPRRHNQSYRLVIRPK